MVDEDDQRAEHRILGQRTDPRAPEHLVGQGIGTQLGRAFVSLARQGGKPTAEEPADAVVVKGHHLEKWDRSRQRRRLVAVRT